MYQHSLCLLEDKNRDLLEGGERGVAVHRLCMSLGVPPDLVVRETINERPSGQENQKKPTELQDGSVIASVTYLRLVSVAFFSKHLAIAFTPASLIKVRERLIQNESPQERSETHGAGEHSCDLL
jgi:hypothetical protein